MHFAFEDEYLPIIDSFGRNKEHQQQKCIF